MTAYLRMLLVLARFGDTEYGWDRAVWAAMPDYLESVGVPRGSAWFMTGGDGSQGWACYPSAEMPASYVPCYGAVRGQGSFSDGSATALLEHNRHLGATDTDALATMLAFERGAADMGICGAGRRLCMYAAARACEQCGERVTQGFLFPRIQAACERRLNGSAVGYAESSLRLPRWLHNEIYDGHADRVPNDLWADDVCRGLFADADLTCERCRHEKEGNTEWQ